MYINIIVKIYIRHMTFYMKLFKYHACTVRIILFLREVLGAYYLTHYLLLIKFNEK